MSGSTSLFTRPTVWSSAAALTLLGCLVVAAPPVLTALTSPSIPETDVSMLLDEVIEEHEAAQQKWLDRFNGRSIFFPPPARRVTVEPPPVRTPVNPTPAVTPPPATPTTYRGPAIMGFDGDRVWFVNDQRLAAGEEAGGVRVISVSAPWSARLAYSGWEGDVTIFRRTSDQLLNGDSSARSMPRGMTEVKGTGAPPSTAKPPKAEDEPDE